MLQQMMKFAQSRVMQGLTLDNHTPLCIILLIIKLAPLGERVVDLLY